MPAKFPFLNALAGEIDKLGFEIEEEAKSIVQKDIAEVRVRKDETFAKARQHVADRRNAVQGVGEMLDKVNEALDRSNSGEGQDKRPT